jgi:HD-like signal output (HDOD) protein
MQLPILVQEMEQIPSLIHHDKRALLQLRTDFAWPRFPTQTDFLEPERLHAILAQYDQQLGADFVVNLAINQPLSGFGTAGLVLQTCENLQQYLDLFHQFMVDNKSLVAPFALEQDKNNLIVRFTDSDNKAHLAYSVALLLSSVQQCAGWWCHAKMVVVAKGYQKVFDGHFDSVIKNSKTDNFSIVFSLQLLQRRFNGANSAARSVLINQLKSQYQHLGALFQLTENVLKNAQVSENLFRLEGEHLAQWSDMTVPNMLQVLDRSNSNLEQMIELVFRQKTLELLKKDTTDEEICHFFNWNNERLNINFRQWFGLSIQSYRLYQMKFVQFTQEQDLLNPDNLPAMSNVGVEIVEMINTENYQMAELVAVIEKDAILTAKIMGLAGTAFYGALDIQNLNDAVTRVFGTEMVRNLAVAILCDSSFKKVSLAGFDTAEYWFEQMLAAELAKSFVDQSHRDLGMDGGQYFLTTMLNNIGFLFLALHAPKPMEKLLAQRDELVFDVEATIKQQTDLLGAQQYQVAALLMEHWHLPPQMSDVVAHVNMEPRPAQSQFLILNQQLSYCLVHKNGERLVELQSKMADVLQLNIADVIGLIDSVAKQLDELKVSCEQLYN